MFFTVDLNIKMVVMTIHQNALLLSVLKIKIFLEIGKSRKRKKKHACLQGYKENTATCIKAA